MDRGGPDIVVVADGRRLIAVQVKLAGDVDASVAQLTRYMEGLPYPVGIAVVGRTMVVLRRDYAQGTVESVGRFDTTGQELLMPPPDGRDAHDTFADRVQRWLESMRHWQAIDALAQPLRGAIAEWVLPELLSGEIRATGPRHQLARVG